MSAAYKQAGITLNRALAISARTVRAALKPEPKAIAEKRDLVDARAFKITNGVQDEGKVLSA